MIRDLLSVVTEMVSLMILSFSIYFQEQKKKKKKADIQDTALSLHTIPHVVLVIKNFDTSKIQAFLRSETS